MKIAEVLSWLEAGAHPSLQESYDNAGLITGNAETDCSGILCSLDATELVIEEATRRKCNLVIAHHPIVFKGLKKITGASYVERVVISAIKKDIAIYAIHTNLDNMISGVNGKMADLLGLVNRRILQSRPGTLRKLYTFVPPAHATSVRVAIFDAGAGRIGNYSECSFNTEGKGTFHAGENTQPFVGQKGELHYENEIRIEAVFPAHLQTSIVKALLAAHPYEEVAYDIIELANSHPGIGSGLVAELPEPMTAEQFLLKLKSVFGLSVIRHTRLLATPIKKVAICGGAGSFLVPKALAAEADIYITADMKYHEFFDADGKMVIADIGHYESEQFTADLLVDLLHRKFPTFAVLKSETQTNPVYYF